MLLALFTLALALKSAARFFEENGRVDIALLLSMCMVPMVLFLLSTTAAVAAPSCTASLGAWTSCLTSRLFARSLKDSFSSYRRCTCCAQPVAPEYRLRLLPLVLLLVLPLFFRLKLWLMKVADGKEDDEYVLMEDGAVDGDSLLLAVPTPTVLVILAVECATLVLLVPPLCAVVLLLLLLLMIRLMTP